jgi:mono/diheme cytochrome c family protein
MRFTLTHLRNAILLLFATILVACGGGSDYDGFDDSTDSSTPDQYLRFFNQHQGDLDDTAYAVAYNAAVDPGNARSTLEDYIALHGLENPDVHVIFRDSKDLGYGRDMYMRSYQDPLCGQITAFYVRNFSVQIVEGFAYGPVNLEAAVDDDLKHHIGTNAIEFGRGRTTDGATDQCSKEPMTKFFTYDPVPVGAQARRVRVDLDGRGAKAMPQPCITCHGGKLRPLDANGDFVAIHAEDTVNLVESQIGDVKARLQAFEVDTFEFETTGPYSRDNQEEGLRMLNLAIYCSYPDSVNDGDTDFVEQDCSAFGGGVAEQGNKGEWKGDFGRDMLIGWYGDALDTPGAKFSDAYVPDGWQPSAGGAPVGADALFTKVIGPNCFVCHGKQGVQLGTDEDTVNGKDVDFSTWDKFISYADDIERLVFDEGRMPLGLLNYQTFWGDPQKAELLASFIAPYVTDSTGFQARRLDANGGVILPGRIVARAGPDRVTKLGAAITLDAQASLFADSYRWELVSSPAASSATLSSPDARSTDFIANTNGKYVVSLTASSSVGASSKADTLTIAVDNALVKAPRALTFYNDITDDFGKARPGTDRACDSCHQGAGGVGGVPMWWTAAQPSATQPAATPALSLYEQAMVRVLPEYIEDSLLLKKAAGQHHYGKLVDGFDTSLTVGSVGRADYDLFVNWIAEGANCGVDPGCP